MKTSVWMVMNGDELARAILADGVYGGPLSDPILEKMIRESNSELDVAKDILMRKIKSIGGEEALKLLPFVKADGKIQEVDELTY